MKKMLLFVAAAAMVSGTMVSCGKTTKGKMEGEWKVDSSVTTETYTSGGSTSTSVIKVEPTTITITETSGGNTSTLVGVINDAKWTINKDGTWERVVSFTFSGNGMSNTTVGTTKGNWDFATGVGEFKKNERVIFSTLSEVTSETETFAGVSTTSISSESYLDGETTEVYVITESKGKSLIMETKNSNSSSSNGNTETNTSETVITLSM